MNTCINCGAEVKELYRRYSPSVLKVLKCDKCGSIADKYIEYDPVIVLVDLVLLEKPAYRHLLYNSNFKSYWKLMVVLLLSESFKVWTTLISNLAVSNVPEVNSDSSDVFEGERNFYVLLALTTISIAAFVGTVIAITEIRWLIFGNRPARYKACDLSRALTVGGCAKLLGLLGIIWRHVEPDPHYALIHGYTVLCLLTAYSETSPRNIYIH
ncbi:protein ARV1 isoform X2 [Cephus cinctus]|uniref:Protein ARV n=1 Tax=Cephus cinctus TaxID=211228 RepID=A0AAJ7R7Z3_CEPCN|nr:protein ARV1 isoform X2 [Cephus cinctus]